MAAAKIRQEQCALCRALLSPGEGLRAANGDLFCSEGCRSEAEEDGKVES